MQSNSTVRCGLGILAFLLCVWVVPSADAQSARDSATARRLFERGVELSDSGQWDGASESFRRAYAIRPSPVIGFNLASSLEHAGGFVESSEVLQAVIRNPKTKPEMRLRAQALLKKVKPKIGQIIINLTGPFKDVQVMVDQETLSPSALNVGFAVDPGEHIVSATREGEEVAAETVDVDDGEQKSVHLVIPPRPKVERSLAPKDNVAALTEGEKDPLVEPKKKKGWVVPVVIVAVVAVAAAVVLAIVLSNNSNQPEGTLGTDTWN